MDPKVTEVSQTFERFKAALVRNDFDTCSKLLSQLKVYTYIHKPYFYLISVYVFLTRFVS